MPTIHEILAGAPVMRQDVLTAAQMQAMWENLKLHTVKAVPGGKMDISNHILASLLTGSSQVRGKLFNYDQIHQFDALLASAKSILWLQQPINPKIKAMHDGCRNQLEDC